MESLRIAPQYSKEWLQYGRLKPLCDDYLESLFMNTIQGFKNYNINHTDEIHSIFKVNASNWILGSKLNKLAGLENFQYVDVCAGCTQFIDNLYIQGPIQVISGDYAYHQRLGLAKIINYGVDQLLPDVPLIISLPFPSIGQQHPSMKEILNECFEKNISVHIDGAWITCSQNINFNFDHPAIKSIGISLSKGLGLGWNRIALRWRRTQESDSIKIMNDFHMVNRMPTIIADYIINNVEVDYFWNNYGDLNKKICNDFNLEQTSAIHAAKDINNQIIGISALMRYLMKDTK
jgi:hypothetical protein